ncbi:hypothetical protein F0562_011319 [Nyssa sinensis]|uniref:Uncharacterized protein n=1 Tax=Nyssa sinensis TaxID=561372 RepID=A0A5J5A4E5_9ASTE|nr:hypothetical protein F0562_011319 [Nyssa sinensis]
MLHKFFGLRPQKHLSRRQVPPKQPVPVPDVVDEGSSALKIVHVGGVVELYYMAVPAARIIEKYPSSILARPDVFRRPWESVVRPEEILTPGQKFFIVPRQTMKKLRRRIRKPNAENPSMSFLLHLSTDVSAELVSKQKDDEFSSKSFNQQSDSSISTNAIKTKPKPKPKPRTRTRRVRFLGIDTKHDSDSNSISMENKGSVKGDENKGLNAENRERKSLNPEKENGERKRRIDDTFSIILEFELLNQPFEY